MKNIEIKNIGPIASVTIPVPEAGGVVVLTGRNGSGKSHALEAVSAATTGKGKPPLKDMAKSGVVSVPGVTMTVARSVRRQGELQVETLEGRLSIADLVDPGFVDPERADAKRIKALVGLSKADISEGDLHGFPENLLDGLSLDDPVAAMAELRKRLNIGANEYEKLSAKDEAAATAILESMTGDLDTPIDPKAAQERVTAALRAMDALQKQSELSEAAKVRIEAARERLAAIPDVDAFAAYEKAESLSGIALEEKEHALELKQQYEEALEKYRKSAEAARIARVEAGAQAEQAKLRAELERQIQEAHVEPPSADALADAAAELEAAKAAQAKAAQQQVMAQQRDRADALTLSAQEYAEEAKELRRRPSRPMRCYQKSSPRFQLVPCVIDGRLVTDTKRGATFYADLSAGERWRIALDIAIQAVGTGGLLVIPQEAWEGLDPANRAAIDAQAKAAKVVVLTAECSADEGIVAVKQ
ncbi:MAG: AAA family ATPase [Candidatus Competibacteraceae bacterium]|nr:AAA family ATPase [Candidatus Competibacteraceae bacterium]